jgi:HK97 family phage portal protein
MRLLDAAARSAMTPIRRKSNAPLSGVDDRGWFSLILDRPPGAFQRDERPSVDTILSNPIVYACISLISGDIGKLRYMLIAYDKDGLFDEIQSPAFSPVLRKPNRFQNHIQFKEWWITSKLTRGNAYALKEPDQRGITVAMYLLDPVRTLPLVAPDGSVFYQLGEDNLSGLKKGSVVVPADAIIHDRMNCLFHPLVGTSPMFASGLAAEQGLMIQRDSRRFFGNASNPGGVLTSPAKISPDLASRMKAKWDAEYSGENAGKVAVLGEGLKFEAMRQNAVDSQMVEQAKESGLVICSTFHVPAYKVGIGPMPLNNNVDALTQDYYSQCLQTLIENMEECLINGMGLDTPKDGVRIGVQLDLSGLFRMDQKTQMETLGVGVDKALITPNEGRKALNKKSLKGGDTVYMQQQEYAIEALAERDANKPFSKPTPTTPATPTAPPADLPVDMPAGDAVKAFLARLRGGFEVANA